MNFLECACKYQKKIVSLQRIMDLSLLLYRTRTWLRHQLTAWNTGGEGVHSPYLFEWVRMVMSDKHTYYKWHEIEQLRDELLKNKREIEFVDYGRAAANNPYPITDTRLICDIARGSLARKPYAQMLARLVHWLAQKTKEDSSSPISISPLECPLSDDKGLTIVELGTSLGITTAYLAAMDSRNRVISYEGCPAVAEIAQENWKSLGLSNIECVVGELSATDIHGPIDLLYIDASHTYASTRAFFNEGASVAHEKTVIVIDDIHHSPEMEQAWKEICQDERVSTTIDLYQMGLVFFDKHYWRRNYKMRL